MSNKDRLDWFINGMTITNMRIYAVPGGFSIHLDVDSNQNESDDERRI